MGASNEKALEIGNEPKSSTAKKRNATRAEA
jgi:hypothetical protein